MFAPSSVALLLSALNVFAGAVATVDSPLQLEEPPAKMQEVGVRTAKDIRRTEAALQFAQGRMAFHREKHADALRHYQRAWRLDPQKSILREIVTLATAIEHDTIAARYALLDPPAIDDAPLLRHLARFVINNEQAEDAITLFEASQQLDHQPPKGLEPIYTALQMGRIYFLHDRWDAATEQFHIYVSALQDPDKFGLNDEALRFLKEDEALNLALAGEAFLSAKRWDAAQSAFAMIKSSAPGTPLYAYHEARMLAGQGQPQEALKKLDQYFQAKTDRTGPEPFRILRELVAATTSPETALTDYVTRLKKLHQINPNNLSLSLALAEALIEQSQNDEAERLLINLRDTAPSIEVFEALLGLAEKRHDDQRCLATIGMLWAASGSPDGSDQWIMTLKEQPRRIAALRDLALQQLKDDPSLEHRHAAIGLGFVTLELERWDDTEKLWTAALHDAPSELNEATAQCGIAWLMAEQYPQAIATLEDAIARQGEGELAWLHRYYLSGALLMEDRDDEAIAAIDSALKQQPDSPLLLNRRAWLLYMTQNSNLAGEAYREFIEAFDSDYEHLEVRDLLRDARMMLSNIEVEKENYPVAEEWLEQVLDEFPNDIGAFNDLGYLWADQQKNLEWALQMVTTAAQSDPENVAYQDSLGWALFRLGRLEEAIDVLTKATSGEEPDAVILEHLGDAQMAAGNGDLAKQAWQRSLKVSDEDGDAQHRQSVADKLKRLEQTEEKAE